MKMTSHLILVLNCILVISPLVQGEMRIVHPLPGHNVAVENETLRVTCVVFDEQNKNVFPTWVNFYRVDKYGGLTRIVNQGPSGEYYFENRTQVHGRKLLVTMVIKRIKLSDSGQYRCVLPNTSITYGFGITYIAKSDLPDIKVSQNITAELGDRVRLTCNITQTGNRFKVMLITIAWLKNNERITEVSPTERNLEDLGLTINKPQDAGQYKCELTSMLLAQRTFNVTRFISVQVSPVFGAVDLRRNEIIRIKGEAVEFHCNATGNPITIVWKRRPRNKKQIIILNETSYSNQSMQTHYKFSRENQYEGFKLEIPKTDYGDRGDYYCCIRSSNASVPDQCQRFTLRVKDPLRHLWPILGIIVEAILLYFIITSSEKAKKSNQQLLRSRHDTTEASPTTSTDGKEESIRLRKMGTPTIDP